MPEDIELLRAFARDRSEAAFAELVRRHIDLVYAFALRRVNGDAHLADDVTQSVFADLARKAAELQDRAVLTGWLYTSTRFAAAKAVRSEQRRRTHEQEAHTMQQLHAEPTPAWEQIRPVLDHVMDQLNDPDREALLLRFFEGRPLAEIGRRLAVSEDAARMRIDRALEKTRALLSRRGITSTSAALAATLSAQPMLSAPAGLAGAVTTSALAMFTAAGAGSLVLETGKTIAMTALQKSALAATFALVLAAGLYETRALQRDSTALATARPASPALAPTAPAISAAGNALKLSPAAWQALLSGDLHQLADRLRTAQFPPDVIVSILREQIVSAYATRIKDLMGLTDEVPPFWSNAATPGGAIGNDPKRVQALLALETEMNDRVRELAGDDFFTAQFVPDSTWGPVTGFISSDKALQLVKMSDAIDRKIADLNAKSIGGVLDPEDVQKIGDLQKERRAAAAAILTPEEFDQLVYKMNGEGFFPYRVLGTVSGRNQLYPFEPTEEEFLTFYQRRKPFAEQYPGDTPAETQERAKHTRDFQDQVAASLSPDRAAEYRTAMMAGSAQVSRLVTRLELPRTAVAETMAVQKEIQDRAALVRADPALDPAARREQLSTLAEEANQRLSNTLGQKGFEAYRQNGGFWIQSLVPRPASPAGPRP